MIYVSYLFVGDEHVSVSMRYALTLHCGLSFALDLMDVFSVVFESFQCIRVRVACCLVVVLGRGWA